MHNNCLNCHVVANETVVCILLSTSVRGNSYAIASGDIVYISTRQLARTGFRTRTAASAQKYAYLPNGIAAVQSAIPDSPMNCRSVMAMSGLSAHYHKTSVIGHRVYRAARLSKEPTRSVAVDIHTEAGVTYLSGETGRPGLLRTRRKARLKAGPGTQIRVCYQSGFPSVDCLRGIESKQLRRTALINYKRAAVQGYLPEKIPLCVTCPFIHILPG